VVVKTWNFSSSIILDRPKSAIRRSEFSAGVRNSKFSGFKSKIRTASTSILTPVDYTMIVQI